jgi:voltage-gated potassium channel
MTGRGHRHFLATLVFTSCLLVLIALAIGVSNPPIAGWALVSVALLATVLHFVLPGGGFFSAVFANGIGIYACVYQFFLSMNFVRSGRLAQQVGFVLPLLGFLTGVIVWRHQIAAAVKRETPPRKVGLGEAMIWLAPLAVIGAGSFIAPLELMEAPQHDMILLGTMFVIALVALVAARGIAVFLLDTGLLFEGFFNDAARLAKPAFALFTCYSLLAIVFGCAYTILDRYSPAANFIIFGASRRITFAEGLYFSVATLSTVGYGDVSAIAPLARILVSMEIFCGLLLVVFGVEAILTSSRKQ